MATVVGSGTSISPAGMTCANLIRYVLDYCQITDDSEAMEVARREIDRAIDRLNAVKWQKLLGSQSITLAADDSDYTVNSDFKEPLHCELLNSDSEPAASLFYMPWKLFMVQFPSATRSGSPSHYTFDFANRTIVTSVAPDSAFVAKYPTARVRYHKRLGHCTQDSDVPGAPPEFDLFIGWYARSGFARLRGRQQDAVFALQEAERAWKMLRVDDMDVDTDWPDGPC